MIENEILPIIEECSENRNILGGHAIRIYGKEGENVTLDVKINYNETLLTVSAQNTMISGMPILLYR